MKTNAILKNLNAPLSKNAYLIRMIALFGLTLLAVSLLGQSSFSVLLILFSTGLMFVYVRRRLISIGWSKWLTLICLLQLLVFVHAELAEAGQLLFNYIFPGFLVLLYFVKPDKKQKIKFGEDTQLVQNTANKK